MYKKTIIVLYVVLVFGRGEITLLYNKKKIQEKMGVGMVGWERRFLFKKYAPISGKVRTI